ncbi:nucleotidyltransferase family protein [Aeromicrobium sp. NPDC092404]|uniref:nucleotidyltransferase family protein n=1 Tax=Aeromicrobium sp. NPDC092404 TaxID=3154976 RepID=UPI0034135828
MAAVQAIGLDMATAEVVDALADRDIDAVLLKGPSTVRRLYADDPDQRLYVDVDLLVAPESFDAAEDVLAACGFSPGLGRLRAVEREWMPVTPWERTSPTPAQVDLHRGFHGVRDFAAFWSVMAGHTEEILVHDRSVAVPDASGCALVVTLHDTAVARTSKAAEDLARALTQLDDKTWAQAARRADACGAAESFALGLSHHPEGRRLAERLGLAAPLSPSVVARNLAEPGDDPAPAAAAALLLERFEDASRWRERGRVVLNIVFPSADHLRAHRPLARRGPLGLAAVRLTWPVALLTRAPKVLLLVRRAQRRSDDPAATD